VAPPPAPAPAPAPIAAPAPAAARTAAAPASSPSRSAGDEYRVRSGDTLSHVAQRLQPQGISLDQMLVALFRSNPQAFVDNNMNRLKAGVVLSVPSADAAKGIPPAEARQVIQAQSADFGAYRQRLAGMVPPAKAEGNARQASGQVQTNVDDRKRAAAQTPDKLTLSKGGAAGGASAPEERISRENERRDAAARVAELSKNVAELNNLRGAAAAAASGAAPSGAPAPAGSARPAPGVSPPPAATTPPATSAAPTPAQALPPAPAPAPAPAPMPAPTPAAAPTPTPAPAAATPATPASVPIGTIVTMGSASAPAAAPTPAPAAAPATPPDAKAPAPPKPAAPRPPVAPPPEEPGFFASMFQDNPLLLGIGGVALLLLAGFGVYRLTRRRKVDTGETSFLESRLQPDSFFGASGGQHIDTRDAGGSSSSMSYSLSQLDAIGDVDPVAEADVYLAYGRDLQAEEILKEAMRSNPERMAIRTKLLEVYAKRRDTKGFELLATQLFALTRGEGEDWAKAQELGQQIDPENPLFQPGGAPPVVAQGEGGQIVEVLGASTMPQSVLPAGAQTFGPSVSGPAPLDGGGLDLDLDSPDIGTPTAPGPLESTQAFAPPSYAEPRSYAEPPASRASTPDDMSLDFTLPDIPPAPPAARPPAPAFEPGSLSLDLDLPDLRTPAPAPAASGFGSSELPALDDAGADPLERKLELAEEFRQIGDTDGARDLLEEVVAKASGALKTRAQGMLDNLS
jgi:pilus assembly protein FimV